MLFRSDDRQLAADSINSPVTLMEYLQKRETHSASDMRSYHRSFSTDDAIGFAHYMNDLRATVAEHLYSSAPLFGGYDEQLDRHWLANNHDAAQMEIDRLNLAINSGPFDAVLAKFNRENPGGDILSEAELAQITAQHSSFDGETAADHEARPAPVQRKRDNAGFSL